MPNRLENQPSPRALANQARTRALSEAEAIQTNNHRRERQKATTAQKIASNSRLDNIRQAGVEMSLKSQPGYRDREFGRRAFFEVSAITGAFFFAVLNFPQRGTDLATPGYDSNDPDDHPNPDYSKPKIKEPNPGSIKPPARLPAPVYQPSQTVEEKTEPKSEYIPKDPKEWFVSQENGNQCGPATFAMILNEAGFCRKMSVQLMSTILSRKEVYGPKGTLVRDENGLQALNVLKNLGINVQPLTEAIFTKEGMPKSLSLPLIRKTLEEDPTVRILVSCKPDYVAENTNITHITEIHSITDDGMIILADPAYPKYIKKDDPRKPLITKKLEDLGMIHYSFAIRPDPEVVKEVEQLKRDYRKIAELAPDGFNYNVWIKSVRKAIEIEKKYGIERKVPSAQIFTETARGNMVAGNNVLGIKANQGEKSVRVSTQEEVSERKIPTVGQFRDFATIEDAIEAYAILITTAPRYRKVQELIKKGNLNPHEQIAAIAQAGYATDSDYAERVSEIIEVHLRGLEKLIG